MKKNKIFGGIIFFTVFFWIFKEWVFSPVIAGGDLIYLYPQFMHSISFLSAWDMRNGGMGSSMLPTLWLEAYTAATIKIFSFINWENYVRLVWFLPYIIFSITSGYFLYKKYFNNYFLGLVAVMLYGWNTYALLLVGGGQMGIALSYAVAPLMLFALENFLEKPILKNSIFFSVIFSVVFLLDIRIAYMMLLVCAIRILVQLFTVKLDQLKKYLYFSPVIIVPAIGLHAFWLLPTYLTHGAAISEFGAIYTGAGAVKFFSFAKFEDAFGLLHPNWPENVFGLTHFMRPEFLVLPLLAYGSLLFIRPFASLRSLREKQEQLYVLFFALLGLLGTFLAKGANDPFGGLYLWMFAHIPGFIMFRDPTKWYLFIALSYSMLIPYTVGKIYEFLQRRFA